MRKSAAADDADPGGKLDRRSLLRSAIASSLLAGAGSQAQGAEGPSPQPANGVEAFFELRIYHIAQGRMQDMHARMRDHLVRLFSHHGIHVAACWEGGSAPRPLFVYLVKWNAWRERLNGWGSFYADPEWLKVRAATNAGHELVERMELIMLRELVPTRPLQPASNLKVQFVPVTIGRLPEVLPKLATMTEAASGSGTELLAAFEQLFGADLPGMVLLTRGPESNLGTIEPYFSGPVASYALLPVSYPIA